MIGKEATVIRHESFDNWTTTKDMMLADLSEKARTILVELEQTEWGGLILKFMHANPRTSLTSDDIAYHLAKPCAEIERDLRKLAQLRLVQTQQVAQIIFYTLTQEPSRQQLAHELCAWQRSWEMRIQALAQSIASDRTSITFTTSQSLRER